MTIRARSLLLSCSLLLAAACDNSVRDIEPPPGPPPTRTVKLASLDGAQETPAVTTSAFGAGVLSVDGVSGAVSGFVRTSGLVSPTAAHVHLSTGRGVPGGVVVPLSGGPDLWVVPDGATPLTAAQIAAFQAGNLYFNVHTPAHAGGEIRGQIDKAGTVALASLGGAQETPAVTTSAFGAGVLAVDAGSGAVAGFVRTSGLVSPTAAHVHQSAGRGVPGGVILPLAGGPDLWVVPDGAGPLSAGQVAAFQGGALYFNAHTPANPSGEIRGQIDKRGAVKLAALDGAQAGVTTSAFGAGLLAVDAASGAVAGFADASGLTGTLAHVHQSAGRGVSGGVVVPMSGGPGLWVVPDGAAALPAASVAAFPAGQLYFNVHTAAHPTGEIRGQIVP